MDGIRDPPAVNIGNTATTAAAFERAIPLLWQQGAVESSQRILCRGELVTNSAHSLESRFQSLLFRTCTEEGHTARHQAAARHGSRAKKHCAAVGTVPRRCVSVFHPYQPVPGIRLPSGGMKGTDRNRVAHSADTVERPSVHAAVQ